MKYSAVYSLAAAGLGIFCTCPAGAATLSGLWVINKTVPDNSILGMSDTRFMESEIQSITDLTVTLNVSGGWAGDLFAYLVHDSGYAVLLNRIGRTSANLLGNSAAGLQVSFSSSGLSDINSAGNSGALLTGSFQPDGRTADPAIVMNTSPRNALFDSFYGLPARGNWTLFVADVAGGDEAMVQSWGLAIVGSIPEPGTPAICLSGFILVSLRTGRARRPA